MMHARSVLRFASRGDGHQRLRRHRRLRRRRRDGGGPAPAGHDSRRAARHQLEDRARRWSGAPSPPRPTRCFICVTNPLDVMTNLAWKLSGLPAERVFGMGGVLDSARFAYFIAAGHRCADRSEVDALVVGAHGDAMVPLPRLSTVDGRPLTDDPRPPTRSTRSCGARSSGAPRSSRCSRPGARSTRRARRSPTMVEAILARQSVTSCRRVRAARQGSTASRASTCRCRPCSAAGGVVERPRARPRPTTSSTAAASVGGVGSPGSSPRWRRRAS